MASTMTERAEATVGASLRSVWAVIADLSLTPQWLVGSHIPHGDNTGDEVQSSLCMQVGKRSTAHMSVTSVDTLRCISLFATHRCWDGVPAPDRPLRYPIELKITIEPAAADTRVRLTEIHHAETPMDRLRFVKGSKYRVARLAKSIEQLDRALCEQHTRRRR